jgi:23S rRNA pseudouridine2605 synthase
VDPAVDAVAVDGAPVRLQGRHYVLLNKPAGVITTMRDPQGRRTVGDLVRGVGARVYPVGRLDLDAEGALLLTDDGDVANRLMHPRYEVRRTYLVHVARPPRDVDLAKLVAGVHLDDGPARALAAEVFGAPAADGTWLALTVGEGRTHLVKRLCAAIGAPVLRLFRPAQGGVSVAGLDPGAWRPLTEAEVERVRASADGRPVPAPSLHVPTWRRGASIPWSPADPC